ncbi:MAG: Cytochrome b/b6 domain, partial [Frankiales bacterium]|nr:Cytochrome b/b6 domain [Frankiales bacterium]
DPSQVSAGSQPDWYVGFLDGSTRLMPNWELRFWDYTFSPNVLLPTQVLPGILFGLLALYPFLEAKLTRDRAYHNLLDRPRDKPVRTALGAMSITFYLILLIAGGNDIVASIFHLSINEITYTLRAGLFILPPLVYVATKRFCLSLQRADDELLHHGIESGTIRRLPSGEFVEETVPLPPQYSVLLATTPERKELTSHGAHGDHPAAPPAPRGFFRPRGGVIEPAPEKAPEGKELEGTVD